MKTYCDNRGFRVFDLFDLDRGQINIQYFLKNQESAVHQHDFSDTLFCVQGSMEITTHVTEHNYRGYKQIKNYINDKITEPFYIPGNIPHSFKALTDNTILLYYMSDKYDQNKIKTL